MAGDAISALEARLASLEQNGFRLNPATANPAPLGLYGFALTTALLMAIKAEVVDVNTNSVGQVMGFAMFFGGLAQFVAGVLEYQRRNTFGFVAFCTYGAFWMSVSLFTSLMQFTAGPASAANGVAQNVYGGPGYSAKMEACWAALWGIVTFLLWLCTFNLNVITSALFLTLSILFWCLSGAALHPSITKGTGGFGFLVAFLAFYDGTAALMRETYGRDILPVWPLKPINKIAAGRLGGFGTKMIVTDEEKA